MNKKTKICLNAMVGNEAKTLQEFLSKLLHKLIIMLYNLMVM